MIYRALSIGDLEVQRRALVLTAYMAVWSLSDTPSKGNSLRPLPFGLRCFTTVSLVRGSFLFPVLLGLRRLGHFFVLYLASGPIEGVGARMGSSHHLTYPSMITTGSRLLAHG